MVYFGGPHPDQRFGDHKAANLLERIHLDLRDVRLHWRFTVRAGGGHSHRRLGRARSLFLDLEEAGRPASRVVQPGSASVFFMVFGSSILLRWGHRPARTAAVSNQRNFARSRSLCSDLLRPEQLAGHVRHRTGETSQSIRGLEANLRLVVAKLSWRS